MAPERAAQRRPLDCVVGRHIVAVTMGSPWSRLDKALGETWPGDSFPRRNAEGGQDQVDLEPIDVLRVPC